MVPGNVGDDHRVDRCNQQRRLETRRALFGKRACYYAASRTNQAVRRRPVFAGSVDSLRDKNDIVVQRDRGIVGQGSAVQ